MLCVLDSLSVVGFSNSPAVGLMSLHYSLSAPTEGALKTAGMFSPPLSDGLVM